MKKKIGLFLSVFTFFVGTIWVAPVAINSGLQVKVDQNPSCNPYASQSWIQEKQINISKAIAVGDYNFSLENFWLFLFYLPEEKWQVVQVDGQSKTLCFKELFSALKKQAALQDTMPFVGWDFDFTKITGIARYQLLQLFDGRVDGSGDHLYEMSKFGVKLRHLLFQGEIKIITPELKTAVAKAAILWQKDGFYVQNQNKKRYLFQLPRIADGDSVEVIWQKFSSSSDWLRRLVWFSFLDPTKAHFFIEDKINNGWIKEFRMIEKAKEWGLISVVVEEYNTYQNWLSVFGLTSVAGDEKKFESVDVTNLANSQVSKVSEFDFSQLRTLRQLKQYWIITRSLYKGINKYKESIQLVLDKLAKDKVSWLEISGKNYQLDQLLTEENLNKPGISLITLTYPNLFSLLTEEESFDELRVSKGLTKDARNQLRSLVKDKITNSQLDTTLNQVLTARENQIQKEKEAKAKPKKRVVKKPTEPKPVGEKPEATKKTKAKKTEETKKVIKTKDKKTTLTIGLATGGGVLLLAGGAGGFLYWFYKIKK